MQLAKSLLSEVFGRRCVLLNTFEVSNCLESLLTLLVDDCCEFSVLMLYLLDDLFLDTFLLLYSRLHGLTFLKRCVRLVKQLFKLAYLDSTRLL